jgi:hypothetical protein
MLVHHVAREAYSTDLPVVPGGYTPGPGDGHNSSKAVTTTAGSGAQVAVGDLFCQAL